MTYDDLKALFEKDRDYEFLEFERVSKSQRRNKCRDICAFILLSEKFKIAGDMVECAEHDEIWLAPKLNGDINLTEDEVITLIRCGVRLDTDNESFSMFV